MPDPFQLKQQSTIAFSPTEINQRYDYQITGDIRQNQRIFNDLYFLCNLAQQTLSIGYGDLITLVYNEKQTPTAICQKVRHTSEHNEVMITIVPGLYTPAQTKRLVQELL